MLENKTALTKNKIISYKWAKLAKIDQLLYKNPQVCNSNNLFNQKRYFWTEITFLSGHHSRTFAGALTATCIEIPQPSTPITAHQ